MRALQIASSIYQNGEVQDQHGNIHKLHSEIPSKNANQLFKVIADDPTILKTLEVGCAYGLSSLHICGALSSRANASHTIIDPFQNINWSGIGVKNLKDAGINFFNLIEDPSEIALPQLAESKKGFFDFILVDGMHTFDHTLLDLFYATLLVRVGGYVAIDDSNWNSVGRAVRYFSNYPCYEIIPIYDPTISTKKRIIKAIKRIFEQALSFFSKRMWKALFHPTLYKYIFGTKFPRVVVLKKISEDNRNWDWHQDNF